MTEEYINSKKFEECITVIKDTCTSLDEDDDGNVRDYFEFDEFLKWLRLYLIKNQDK